MNHSNQPGQPDDLDRLLAAYFKAQVPDPWPPFRGSPAEPSGLRSASAPSRYVLAASAAALLGLGLYLSSGVRQPVAPADHATHGTGLLKDATANGKGLVSPAANR
jgi:hypothetical protein